MKYYYGNSYKEAISNNPITINSIKVLEDYKEVYNCVIPVEIADELPATVTINIDDLDCSFEDEDELNEIISDWLSDEYGYCNLGFDYKTDVTSGDITVDNIDWDIDEY